MFGKFIVFTVVAAVVCSVLFQTNVDFRYTTCFLGGLGYLDFLGSSFTEQMISCIAETSTYYLKRDTNAGDGKIVKIHEFDCSKDFSLEKLRIETRDFTIPVVCRNLLKDNKCRKWSLDYFDSKSLPNESFRVFEFEPIEGRRKAFMRNEYPNFELSEHDTYDAMKKGAQYFVSFDNYFFTKIHPELTAEMDLAQYFPGIKFILNTLFMSNFTQKTLGSPFHAAPNDNFFFQCVGRKHWFYVPPKDLMYVGTYISNGVTFTSSFMNETDIVDRLTIYEAVLEEGDMMYNPPFWLHAVGTVKGLTISVANRAWERIFPQENNGFFDIMYKLGFPNFIAGVIKQKLSMSRVTSVNLQNSINVEVSGGALEIVD